MSVEELLKLPFEIQLVLAAGYLAYRLATVGLDKKHRAADTIFQVFVYGTVAFAAYAAVSEKVSLSWAIVISTTAALMIAALWRAVGLRIFVCILRALKITRENFAPSTWDSILDARRDWGFVSVVAVDNVAYDSNIERLKNKLPLGPLELDRDGNVALYVTRIVEANGDEQYFQPIDEFGRAHLTYIPANQIKTVTVSFVDGSTTSVSGVQAAETADG